MFFEKPSRIAGVDIRDAGSRQDINALLVLLVSVLERLQP